MAHLRTIFIPTFFVGMALHGKVSSSMNELLQHGNALFGVLYYEPFGVLDSICDKTVNGHSVDDKYGYICLHKNRKGEKFTRKCC